MSQIRGEYVRVSRWTTNREQLKLAHNTECTQLDAIAYIIRCADRHDIKCPNIKFKDGRGIGLANYTNWELTLPEKPESGYGLRWGVVIHEMAHLVAGSKAKEYRHGFMFVLWLDILIMEWYNERIRSSEAKFQETSVSAN